MRVEINENGNLSVERSGKLKIQYCPRTNTPCGDHCPLFYEPRYMQRSVYIRICNERYFEVVDDNFKDLRIKREKSKEEINP
jgi:hypothetical protein